MSSLSDRLADLLEEVGSTSARRLRGAPLSLNQAEQLLSAMIASPIAKVSLPKEPAQPIKVEPEPLAETGELEFGLDTHGLEVESNESVDEPTLQTLIDDSVDEPTLQFLSQSFTNEPIPQALPRDFTDAPDSEIDDALSTLDLFNDEVETSRLDLLDEGFERPKQSSALISPLQAQRTFDAVLDEFDHLDSELEHVDAEIDIEFAESLAGDLDDLMPLDPTELSLPFEDLIVEVIIDDDFDDDSYEVDVDLPAFESLNQAPPIAVSHLDDGDPTQPITTKKTSK